MAAKKDEMSDSERLKLLEQRYKKKEMSKETYESLRSELEGKRTAHVMPVVLGSSSSSKLTPKKRLKLLEKRYKNEEISEDTYNKLKTELESEMAQPTQVTTPAPIPVSGDIPPSKEKKFPVLPVVAVIAIIGIIILAAAVAGVFTPEASSNKSKGEDEIFTEKTQWEDVETIEGNIAGGGPMTMIPDIVEPFEVENTVYQMEILLTWNPQSMDLDLVVKDPSGDERGTSGNSPGTPESVLIKKNIDPGTWTAEIDPFAAVNVHYTLEITYYHESGNETEGEGELLYQQTKSLSQETSDQTDTFLVEDEYEGLFIQVEISSGEGSMEIEILNPDGDVVISEAASGADSVSEQDTVDSMQGEWTVNYAFDEFTGTVVVQVVGM